MDRNELLQTSHPPKSGHRPLSPSERQVRILGPIVELTTRFLAPVIPDDFHRSPVRRTLVRHDNMRIAVPLHCFLQEFQRSSLIPLLRDIGFQDFAFVVDSSPEIVPLAAYLHKDLVQVPSPLRAPPHRFGPPFPDLVCEVCAEPIDPEPHAFVANVDPTLMKKVFDIAK